MKKLTLLILSVFLSVTASAQNNTDESKPSAAVAVVESLTNTFLPGVFSGVKTLLNEMKGKAKDQDELNKLKDKIASLESKSETLRKDSKEALQNLKSYYDSEVLDFKTLNEIYYQISIFSTKVSSLTMVADLLTDDNVGFSSDEAKIAVINRTKDAARAVVSNFNVDVDNLVSQNTFLNANVTNKIRIIKEVIQRINGSGMVGVNRGVMSEDEINNYLFVVRDIKLNGSRRFAEMENSVSEINTDIAAYLKAFETKSTNINAKIQETITSISNVN